MSNKKVNQTPEKIVPYVPGSLRDAIFAKNGGPAKNWPFPVTTR